MSRGRSIIALVAAVLAVVLGLAWWMQRGPATSGEVAGTDQGSPAPAPASSGSRSGGTAPGSAGATPAPSSATTPARGTASGAGSPATTGGASTASALPAGCAARHTPITPSSIQLRSMGVDSPVLSLGLADDGTPQTPPFSQPYTVGWYNLGPKPGARQGKAVLTAHTFSRGHALGNAMADARTGLKPGAVISMTDGQGRTLCWLVSGATKVWVKDYDPDSTVIYDDAGRPELAIVICWDYDKGSKFWASRIVYHAEPLVG